VTGRDYRILIGTTSWKYAEWGNEVFYPEDLPEDWYLSFYSNEFPVALVPAQQWADVAAAEQLVDEINEQGTEGFKCIFELDLENQSNVQARLDCLTKLESFLGGLLVRVSADFLSKDSVREQLVSLCTDFKICIDVNGSANTDKLTAFCEQHAISVCWRGEGEVIVPSDASLWLARCNSSEGEKAAAQQLKKIISEQLKRESPFREHVLIIDGVPPSLLVTRNAGVMVDIM